MEARKRLIIRREKKRFGRFRILMDHEGKEMGIGKIRNAVE